MSRYALFEDGKQITEPDTHDNTFIMAFDKEIFTPYFSGGYNKEEKSITFTSYEGFRYYIPQSPNKYEIRELPEAGNE